MPGIYLFSSHLGDFLTSFMSLTCLPSQSSEIHILLIPFVKLLGVSEGIRMTA